MTSPSPARERKQSPELVRIAVRPDHRRKPRRGKDDAAQAARFDVAAEALEAIPGMRRRRVEELVAAGELTPAGLAAAGVRHRNRPLYLRFVQEQLTRAEVAAWRQVLRPIDGLGAPGTKVVGLPFSFQGAAPVDAVAAPHMGEHGREVLRDWLDLDEPTIAELFQEAAA